MLGWCRRGVRIYRVDNPHTKSVPFWEWLIREVRAEFPDTVFLAEAFTRPAMMTTLGKIGFGQSYTYFTWKNTKAELVEFLEQARSWSPYYRPNVFANTPDILHEYLQEGGRPAFEARLVLAATLSPTYGIYSGYEHCENVPVREGSEEYLDSEKYELKKRTLDGPLLPLVRRLNEIRRTTPALQRFENLHVRWRRTTSTCSRYAKIEGASRVVVVVNLDPFATRGRPRRSCPIRSACRRSSTADDLLSGLVFRWRHWPQLREARPRPGAHRAGADVSGAAWASGRDGV